MKKEFKGTVFELMWISLTNFILCTLTIGIFIPFACCRYLSWKTDNTIIDGKKFKFIGSGFDLLLDMLIWILLSIFTLGIYAFWIPVKYQTWIVKNTIMINE